MPKLVHILALPGNTGSLVNAFNRLDCRLVTAKDAEAIEEAERLIIPGQGRFDTAVKWIDESGWRDALNARFKANEPTLGICLGMQIMFSGSDEGRGKGLDWFKGRIERLPEPTPNIGWMPTWRRGDNTMHDKHFYYVHSFAWFDIYAPQVELCAARPTQPSFVASVCQGKTWGCQFHPEKSQKDGEAYLKAWLNAEILARRVRT